MKARYPTSLLVLLAPLAVGAQDNTSTPTALWDLSPRERAALRYPSRLQAGESVTIDGRSQPYLFMPWELLDHLFNTAFASHEDARKAYRTQYSDTLNALGILEIPLPDGSSIDFWTFMEEAGTSYLAARRREWSLAENLPTASATDRSHLLQQIEESQSALCTLRYEALGNARALLGQDSLHTFLYTAIAPTLLIRYIADADDVDPVRDLVAAEGGCR